MSRILAFVGTAGLIGAAAFLAIGTAILGPSWASAAYLWNGETTCEPATGTQQQASIPIVSSDRLEINLPGSIHFQPGEKAEAVVTGDSTLLSHLRVERGRLGLDCTPVGATSRLDIKLSGPAITKWDLISDADLTLSQIDQPELQVSIKGSGNASASGMADRVKLSIFGSGGAQFESLSTKSAIVEIRGSGNAKVAAQTDADVSIYGTGNVELLGHPTVRRADIKGSGRIVQAP